MGSTSPEEIFEEINNYAHAVVNGEIVACKKLVKTCERHFKDLENEEFEFSKEEAFKIVSFAELLSHTKGKWKTPNITLEPWQKFFLGSIFGWRKKENGHRRFNTVYAQLARKNAKSTMAAIVGLYCLIAEDEVGPEVYSAATSRDQARIVFDAAKAMAEKNSHLKKILEFFKNNITYLEAAGKFEPLSAEAGTLDGKNVSCGIVDELHAHKNSKVWGVLETATGSRLQPLMFGITTAGYERALGIELYNYSDKLLSGFVEDDSFFAFITEMDEGDDWTDPKVWAKANPNLGVSVFETQLERLCAKAVEIPSEQNEFLCKHLNIWVNQSVAWIPFDAWKACGGEYNEEELLGRECWGGMDLSFIRDLTAFVLVFPPVEKDERFKFIYRFWAPGEIVVKRSRGHGAHKVPYDAWVRDGFIKMTHGNEIDLQAVRSEIIELSEKYNIKQIAYDRFGATETAQRLQEAGLDMVIFRQGAISFHEPMDRFMGMLLDGKLNHGNHPTMNWMAGNMTARHDANMNMAPDKRGAKDKIDGMVALLMGLGLYLKQDLNEVKSIYEEENRDFIF